MYLSDNYSTITFDRKKAIHFNGQIIDFFEGVMEDQEITSLSSPCPGGTSLEWYLIQIAQELEDHVNISTFLHRLARLFKMKSISGNKEFLYANIFQILMQDLKFISNQNWTSQDLGNVLYGIGHLVGSEIYIIVQSLMYKVDSLDLNTPSFLNLQSLVIGINIAGIDIPENINTKWNEYVHDEGKKFSKRTKNEKKIFDEIMHELRGDGLTPCTSVFLQGFEVDIVVLDVNGKIFAVIESDGIRHENPIYQNRDNRRDRYFLEVGVTDLIIRVSQKGCKILATF